jgi:hypothetical protein
VIGKYTRQFINKFLPPLTDLIRVCPILAGEFSRCSISLQGLQQRYLGFKSRESFEKLSRFWIMTFL